ncbi:hypothetical protein LTR66_008565 [Elasticomyces elasticus]|nr:hypothetical protein LTR66_008565 [Elasticomyces elasticus]KAK4986866.1 hypothetical protein LTR50_004997 [Elasticomyces elasticus]
MKFTPTGLALLLCNGVALALPRPPVDHGSCYGVHYKHDEHGNKYGGSYNKCAGSFDDAYGKPNYRVSDGCWKTRYEHDDCGHQFGGYAYITLAHLE